MKSWLFSLVVLAVLSFVSDPVRADTGVVVGQAPASVAGEVLSLPDITFTSTEPRVTAFVVFDDAGISVEAAHLSGGAGVLVLADGVITVLGDGGTYALEGLSVTRAGGFVIGDSVGARLIANNPNTGTVLLDKSVVLADVRGTSVFTVDVFNPGGNDKQQSVLRLSNASGADALVRVVGVDDAGARSSDVWVSLLAQQSLQATSQDLELGNPEKGIDGALGDGVGKWRLRIDGTQAGLRVSNMIRNNAVGSFENLGGVSRLEE